MKLTEDQVFAVIENYGPKGATKKDIAAKLNVDLETPMYRIRQLLKAGLITESRDVSCKRFFAKPKVQVQVNPHNTVHPPIMMPTYPDSLVCKPQENIVVRKSDLDMLVNSFVSALATSVVEKLRPMIVEKLSDSIGAMAAEVVGNIAPPKEKPKLPSILVGGLHPDQTKMIEKEFDGVADLRFVGADESNSVWKSRSANAQHTVLMVDFLSHKHIETVRAVGVEPIILRGGLTKMRDKLMELSV